MPRWNPAALFPFQVKNHGWKAAYFPFESILFGYQVERSSAILPHVQVAVD